MVLRTPEEAAAVVFLPDPTARDQLSARRWRSERTVSEGRQPAGTRLELPSVGHIQLSLADAFELAKYFADHGVVSRSEGIPTAREIAAHASAGKPTESAAWLKIFNQMPIRAHDPVQEQLRQRGAEAVLNGTEWLTSAEVDGLAPAAAKRSNAHARANRLLAEGRIFAIEHDGKKRYPRYAFDNLGNPQPILREVLRVFDGTPALRIASWFESTSAALDGQRPRSLMERQPRAVLQAARAHVEGPVHG